MTDKDTTAVLEGARAMQIAVNEAGAGRVVPVEHGPMLERLTALRQTLAPTLTDTELELFAMVATRKKLDPFSGQITAVKRNTKQGQRVSFQTGIDGYRSIAEDTGQYLGSELPVFGPDCGCGTPRSYHPAWAEVTVHRLHPSGQIIHQAARAKWHEFIPPEDFMWVSKPEVMLGKTAEAQALRKAFPWVLADLYIPEEMATADNAVAPPQPAMSARAAVAAKAAQLRNETTSTTITTENPTIVITERNVTTPDDPPDDPAPPAPVPAEPTPDAGGPGAAMDAETFKRRTSEAGLSLDAVTEAGKAMFPGRRASTLTEQEWGALYASLVT